MSAKSQSAERPKESPVADSTDKPAVPPKRMLIIACAIAVVWISALVILAIATANPVTLNRKQIRHSEYVVTAKRTSSDSRTVEVSKEWKRGEALGTITITNLDQVAMPAEKEFLVPLQKLNSGRFSITRTSLPNEAPLIYPASPEAEAQLALLLAPEND